ncbi:type II secretion system protein GspL [Vibrio sp. WJH972]
MNNTLIIRISNQEGASAPWWIWSESEQRNIESGELPTWYDLPDLPEHALSLNALILIDSADLMLKQIELPKGSGRHLDKMLPFLVEEDIAQDIESLHLTVLHKQGNKALVSGIDAQWLRDLCQLCRENNVDVARVIPDVLVLPDSDSVMLMAWQQQWLVRDGMNAAYVLEDSWLSSVIQTDWQPNQRAVTLLSPNSADNIVGVDDWQRLVIESPEVLLSQGAMASRFTLLSGEFKLKKGGSARWNVWRKVLFASVFLFALYCAQIIFTVQSQKTERMSIRAESERIFRSVFPDKQRIPTLSYLTGQLDNEVARLSGGNSQNSILVLLDELSKQISEIDGIQLNRLNYDESRGEIRIDLQGVDFQNFEQAKNKLSTDFDVESGPLNRNGELVLGSFTLKRGQ